MGAHRHACPLTFRVDPGELAGSGRRPGLFGPGEPLDAAQEIDAPGTLRARSAGLNLSVVEQVRQQLAAGQTAAPVPLNLFPDVQLTAQFSRLEPSSAGGITLAGKIDGSPLSEIHLSQVGTAFFASLNTSQGLFRASFERWPDRQNLAGGPGQFSERR